MRPANIKAARQPKDFRWKPKRRKKEEQISEPTVLCRVIPPVVALIPELLDTPVPKNYSPEQAIDLLRLKIENRLLL